MNRFCKCNAKLAISLAALQKANAGSMQIENFRDSMFQIIVNTAVPAIIAAA
jgi:hypothetical protein